MDSVTRVGKIALVLPVRIDSLLPVLSIKRCNRMDVNRREFVGGALAAALVCGVREQSQLQAEDSSDPLQLYWGDLHNHNAVGYATGTLEARTRTRTGTMCESRNTTVTWLGRVRSG